MKEDTFYTEFTELIKKHNYKALSGEGGPTGLNLVYETTEGNILTLDIRESTDGNN